MFPAAADFFHAPAVDGVEGPWYNRRKIVEDAKFSAVSRPSGQKDSLSIASTADGEISRRQPGMVDTKEV